MKERVVLSKRSTAITFFCLAIAIGTFLISMHIFVMAIICSIAICVPVALALWYCPLSIEISDKYLYINRSISPSKKIKLSDIKIVRIYQPSIYSIRICGSGGFLGWWGWFRDPIIGTYFAYYGIPKDCFIVELTNGRIYLLGCKNSKAMISVLKERISCQ